MTAPDRHGTAGAISRSQVARLLAPRSVAIIGVSERENSAGRQVLANLESCQFSGDVHLVSRNAKEIEGRACLNSVDQLPRGVDCAVLTVPGAAIEETVEGLARREVGSIMCFASGFAEVGGTGQDTQDRIAALCRSHDIAFAGPNCLGFVNAVDKVAVTFSKSRLTTQSEALKIGIVVQSGGMAAVLRTAAAAAELGFSYAITTGNEAVIGVEDYLPFLIEDPETRVVVVLMEQIRQPGAFMRHAAAARAAGKPIVLLHLSRGAAAKHSALTHTGALAGDYAVMEAFVKSENVILVDTIDELIDVSTILAHYPHPPGGGIGIVTESGAFKGFALDFSESIGMTIAELQPETRAIVADAIPDFVEATNPVDLTAQAIFDNSMYNKTIKALLNDPGIGAVMLSMMVDTPDAGLAKADFALQGKAGSDKPVLCTFLGGDQPIHPDLIPRLTAAGVPFFRSPERGMRAIARVLAYGDTLRTAKPPPSDLRIPAPKIEAAGPMPEYRAKKILAAAGFPVPKGDLASSADEAVAIAEAIGYPVVIKAQATTLTHKSDIGGVAVNLRGADDLRAAWDRMTADVAAGAPGIELDGILVETMGGRGVEMVVGARRDPAWGPTLMIGLGGIWTEVLGDVRFLPANAAPAAIADAVATLKGARLLHGFRGGPPADIDAFAAVACRIGALMLATPRLAEIDLNPVVVFAAGDGILVLDALLVAD